MSAGTGASNLGYGNVPPFSNNSHVNGDNSHYPGNFGSTVVPGTPPGPLPGLGGTKSNVDAAAGIYRGGGAVLKRKIKNISKQYKRMKAGSRRIRRLKTLLRKSARKLRRSHKRTHSRHKRRPRTSRKQRGGYAQYGNNLPFTQTYQVAGVNLPASQLALANPPPISVVGGNCIDNYDHYTNMGFPSKGH
jgi:hypothetical protein